MSTTVDQRVVEMQFDNKQFEADVSTTMSTLDKLKQSLNLSGASKGLEDVSSAAKNCDVSVLGGAVETVKAKFSALEVMGVTALANITNSAVNAGKRIVSALTIDPVRMGFSEYETQMNAVQTILANTESKGKTLEDVNGALDELNAYADKTIYNFTEMTRNIGTFTAAGVDLDTSVSAIKGIANLAAVSGSTSQQASTAMYQLSQAMASGTVKLMDWNSVVNAGMGGQVFQDSLKETAKAHGIAIDDIIKKQGSFRESLSEGWLTTEILTETLSKFTGDLTEDQLKSMGYTEEQIEGILKMGKTANDAATKVKTFSQLFDTLKEAAQSGWAQTWEIIVGDFEEAKAFLTEVSDTIGGIIGKSAEARNELLENWKTLGGRDDLIESLRNVFEGVSSIVKPIKEAFREIFPPTTAEQLKGFTEGLKNLTAKLKLSDGVSDKLKRTFKGLFAIVDIMVQVFSAAFNAVKSLFGGVGELGDGVFGVTASFGDWLVNISEMIRNSGILNKVFKGIADVIKAIIKVGSNLFGFLKDNFVAPGLEALRNLLHKVGDGMSLVGEAAKKMKEVVMTAVEAIGNVFEKCSLFKLMEGIWKAIKLIGTGLAKAFSALTTGLTNSISQNGFGGFFELITSLITGGILVKVINFLKNLKEPLEEMKGLLSGFVGGITDVLDGIKGCLEGYQEKLKSEVLQKIATAIGILAAAILVLSLIDADRLGTAIGAITALFTELIAATALLGHMKSIKGVMSITTAMTALSTALLILAVAMKIMSTMSWSELGVGLIGISVGLGLLVGAVNLLPTDKVKNAAKAIKTMSTALLILAVAMKIMSTMSWEEMGVGLITTAVSLGLLVGAVNLLPTEKVKSAAGAIKTMSTALLILSLALKIMGTMSWSEVGVGLVTMAGGLALMVGALWLIPKDIGLKTIGLLTLATSLVIMAAALKIMGSMTWEEMAIGLVALGGALLILAVALNSMMTALPGAAALLVATAALAVLTPVLIILGSLSWETIIKGLVTIAGAFTIIGVAGLLLLPIVPAILALAGAIMMIGVGTLAAGTGLIAFGAGLSAIAIGFTAIVASLSAVVTGIIAVVSAVITGVLKGIADGIVAFCNVIIAGAPAICEAAVVVITSLCTALIATIPTIINTVHVLLTELLNFIVAFVPELVDAGIKLIVGVLNGIASQIDKVIAAGVNVIMSFLEGIAEEIPAVVDKGMEIMTEFCNSMAEAISTNTPLLLESVNTMMEAVFEAIGLFIADIPRLGLAIIKGLGKGLIQGISGLLSDIGEVCSSIWDGITGFFGIHSPSRLATEAGMYIDEGLAVGLKEYANVAGDAATNVGEKTMDSLSGALSHVSDAINGDMDIQPTIRPVLDLTDVESGASGINGLLNSGAYVEALANVGAISSMRSNQNGGNSDIVSAIKKLSKDISGIKTETNIINGVTYDDGSNINGAVKSIVRAARLERRTN